MEGVISCCFFVNPGSAIGTISQQRAAARRVQLPCHAFHRAVVSAAVACGVGLGLVDGSASAGGQSGASAAMRELALGGILRR